MISSLTTTIQPLKTAVQVVSADFRLIFGSSYYVFSILSLPPIGCLKSLNPSRSFFAWGQTKIRFKKVLRILINFLFFFSFDGDVPSDDLENK